MKVTMIGSHLCQDTLYALMQLKAAGVEVDFQDIHSGFSGLREYLAVRDGSLLYREVKCSGKLGIPYLRLEDGSETLDVREVLERL